MTTWTQTIARDVADTLHEVNYYLGLARANVLNGHEGKAADCITAATMAKDRAVELLPPVALAGDARLAFKELYFPFWTKDLLMYQALHVSGCAQNPGLPPNPIAIPWEHLVRELRGAAESLRPLLNRPWPADDPCKGKLEAIIDTLERAADLMEANPAGQIDLGRLEDEKRRLMREQKEFLECAYAGSPVPMAGVLAQFNAMNLWLINIYSALRFGLPPWGVERDRRRELLFYIETVEGFKAVVMDWLDQAYSGTNEPLDGWNPGDLLEVPPDHASRRGG